MSRMLLKKLWILSLALLLTPAVFPRVTVAVDCMDPNLFGIVWENGEFTMDTGPGIVTATAYIFNPSPTPSTYGYEFWIHLPQNVYFTGVTYYGNAINVATAPDFAVGLANPLLADPDGTIALLQMSFLAVTTDQLDFMVSPTSVPSIPVHLVYASGLDPGILYTMDPVSGDFDQPIARLNGPDLPWCQTSYDFSVGIAAGGDGDNIAAVMAGATDGYDSGIDLLEATTGSHVWFPHPEWGVPGGPKFKYDVKAPYDPLLEVGQWSFVVQVEGDVSFSTMVQVVFSPSFTAGDGIDLVLYDQTSGGTTDLFPSLAYSYSIPPGLNSRQFSLFIGNETQPYDLSVEFQAMLGGLTDANNIAATLAGASDAYDPGLDLPEPPAPPTNFLTAYFPHLDWPLERYQTDVRAPFDPLSDLKTWSFSVETDQSGTVTLSFNPSFNDSSGYRLQLHDQTTGMVQDLFPNLSYNFYADNNRRDFDLMIGRPSTLGLTLLIDATANGIQDIDNLAATRADATDDYDPGIDVPEPAPPPYQFVSAYFPHPSWPFGPRFHDDVQALYDPLEDTKTWPFKVESDQSGTMLLTFEPSFNEASGIDLHLRDVTTGNVMNLFPKLQYTYSLAGSSTRDFEVIIGPLAAPPPMWPIQRSILSGWSLVGFPLVPPVGQQTLQDVILDDVTGLAYLYRYLGNAGYELAEGTDVVVQGQGLWIGADQPFTWSMQGDQDLDGISVPLRNGWTLVGYPLWFPGNISRIKVDYGGNRYDFWDAVNLHHVSASVYDYSNDTDAYVLTDSLTTWHGYWMAGLRSGVSLWFDYRNYVGPPRANPGPDFTRSSSAECWRVTLDLDDGLGKATWASFGIHPEATDAFDPAFDHPTPPLSPTGSTSHIAFYHPEWNVSTGHDFLTDIVAPYEQSQQWEALVVREKPGPVTLQWDPTNWPEDIDFQVYLPSQNRVVILSMRERHNVTIDVGATPVEVHFRTPDFVTGIPENEITDYLITVQPNPFNPTTKISFQTPGACQAEIRIYDMRGRLIRTLPAGAVKAGHHELLWYGRDDAGRNVASGLYFCVLVADGDHMGPIQKMSLVR
jgi:hypothetical protein